MRTFGRRSRRGTRDVGSGRGKFCREDHRSGKLDLINGEEEREIELFDMERDQEFFSEPLEVTKTGFEIKKVLLCCSKENKQMIKMGYLCRGTISNQDQEDRCWVSGQ